MKIKVVIHRADKGGFWADVPGLPGCYSQGETLAEVEANIREAIQGYLLAVNGDATPESAGETMRW